MTRSWAPGPLHTSRAGSSGYSASFLAMRSFTHIIIAGTLVSNEDSDVIKATHHPSVTVVRFLVVPLSFRSICLPQPLTLSPCHPTTTSAFSSTFVPRDFPTSTRAWSFLWKRARRDVLFLCAKPSDYRDAPTVRRPGPRAIALVLHS